jgi:hypothetical protein
MTKLPGRILSKHLSEARKGAAKYYLLQPGDTITHDCEYYDASNDKWKPATRTGIEFHPEEVKPMRRANKDYHPVTGRTFDKIHEMWAFQQDLNFSRPDHERLYLRYIAAGRVWLQHVKDVWTLLGDIPVDEDECIECWFWRFAPGTHREEIWKWVEEDLGVRLPWLMYNEGPALTHDRDLTCL